MTQDTRSQLCASAAAFAEYDFFFHGNAPFAAHHSDYSNNKIPYSGRGSKLSLAINKFVLFIKTIKYKDGDSTCKKIGNNGFFVAEAGKMW